MVKDKKRSKPLRITNVVTDTPVKRRAISFE
jgi:hypothetical protein